MFLPIVYKPLINYSNICSLILSLIRQRLIVICSDLIMREMRSMKANRLKGAREIVIKLNIKMSTSNNISVPNNKCMKCREERDILMSSCSQLDYVFGCCDHKFCESCFRKENTNLSSSRSNYTCNCPCCHSLFYENTKSIDEAILIGEAFTIRTHISNQLSRNSTDLKYLDVVNKLAVKKLEEALVLNPANIDSLNLVFRSCCHGYRVLVQTEKSDSISDYYILKSFEYSYKLLDHPSLSERYESVKDECSYKLATVFGATTIPLRSSMLYWPMNTA